MRRPRIGITANNRDHTAVGSQYESALAYSKAVSLAGGLPLILPHEIALVEEYLAVCDGLVLTGGADPKTEAFGQPTHLKARVMDPQRQAFELALLAAADRHRDLPVLGICLGMQLMALHAGGSLHQHLPDWLATNENHEGDRRHPIDIKISKSVLLGNTKSEPGGPPPGHPPFHNKSSQPQLVVSSHRQAVDSPGSLRLVATSPDGVVEAIDDPARPFYLGVQWHPERGGVGPFNSQLFEQLVAACPLAT